ncbi:MAG: hypothetical protein HY342_09160, partial [Candidatus Lambdaproteobacteria bacterium]|nr:hypothetical protein [Candidatus Lambdaproteobacteria bacterium]
ELQDLADTFRKEEIEVRFTRQLVREEDEINLASAQYAQGVRVRGKAVREVRPETSLKGCLAWLRTVAARPDRGLHLRLESRTATNGVALVLAQIFARRQHAFATHMDEGNWEYLTAVPDPQLASIPEVLQSKPGLQQAMLERQLRPTGFVSLLQQVARLEFLPPDRRAAYQEIVRTRDADAIKALAPAEVINLALIYEYQERYRGLLESFFKFLAASENVGELATQFELLCQGIALETLQERLMPFVLEQKQGNVTGKRSLLNEIRIGLNNSDALRREHFESVFTVLVLGHRLVTDPGLYRRVVRLEPTRVEEQEVLAMVREELGELLPAIDAFAATSPSADMPASDVIRRKLFELVVRLTLLGRYNDKFGDGGVPPGPTFARGLLSCFSFKVFKIGNLRTLNPRLPYKGVAKNLTDKVPVTWGEVTAIREQLAGIVFPMGELTRRIAASVRRRFKDQEKQKRVGELNAYLQGSYPLISNSNYILGQAGMTVVMRQGLLDAGEGLGLTMLASRDLVRRREGPGAPHESNVDVEGYLLLMLQDDARLFPLRAHPDTLRRAYNYLFRRRVAGVARRFVNNKLSYLVEKFQGGLFEIIYQHVVWRHQISLSRQQLRDVLVEQNVFDADRVRSLGFEPEPAERAADRANAFLRAGKSGGDEEQPLDVRALEQTYIAAVKRMKALRDGYKAHLQEQSLRGVLARLSDNEVLNLHDARCAEPLGASPAADVLWNALERLIKQHYKLLLAGARQEEAVRITLHGPLAYLALLRRDHTVLLGEKPFLFRLQPDWDLAVGELSEGSRVVAVQLQALLDNPAGAALKEAQALLAAHDGAWRELRHVGGPVLVDVILRESILHLIKPRPPLVKDLRSVPEERVMCLGTSSLDQGKFSRVVAHPERRELYATISELASWLARFTRLRDEMEEYRTVSADICGIISSFNFSLFDAPYIDGLSRDLVRLSELLTVRPEDITLHDLDGIEQHARQVSKALRDIHRRELQLPFKDRWLSRIVIRLRGIRSNVRLNFVDTLFEGTLDDEAPAEEDGAPPRPPEGPRRSEDYQTFSERVRNVIQARDLLVAKDVYVISPANTQERLTVSVIDQLFRLRGLFLPIFADVSGCPAFEDTLRARLPPHRLFNMSELQP